MSSIKEKSENSSEVSVEEASQQAPQRIHWYRSTYWNAIVLGMCNFCAPGLWGAMNSLGAGGAETPYQVNAANALIFCLMVLTASASSSLVNVVGIRITLILGTLGYAPYAAGLYTNIRFGNDWFLLFGAALCGLAAGTFWMAEGAIALSYPEPERQGKFLGLWLTFKIAGQVVGGAINLGINVKNSGAGAVSDDVYLVFIALQCLAPFVALLLTSPAKLQRTDGLKVDLRAKHSAWTEIKLVTKLFFRPKFMLLVPLISCYIYTESVMFTYLDLWFSVRARSLGSFVSGIAAGIAGNIIGRLLDNERWPLKYRARASYFFTIFCQGGLLAWNIANSHSFIKSNPTYDWVDPGFGNAFAVYVLQVANFQVCYMAFFWYVGELAETTEEVARIAGLLRATESAAQAVSYGLSSLESFAHIYSAVVNLSLWGVAVIPGWIIIRQIGVKYGKEIRERQAKIDQSDEKLADD